jgi:hypothetical protein
VSTLKDDPVAVLEYILRCVERMREIATSNPSLIGRSLRGIADDIARKAAELEAELIKAGFLPNPANEP